MLISVALPLGGLYASMMVSVRDPSLSPVARLSFCCWVKPSRESLPTISQVVPGVSEGRPA
ncbi:Uncharacterised protein [Mycobacteroides abscessus subsp. abscessus]|nr:Uncharacterised protein [Mycobacteroides abscessus subsp. abscessus]